MCSGVWQNCLSTVIASATVELKPTKSQEYHGDFEAEKKKGESSKHQAFR